MERLGAMLGVRFVSPWKCPLCVLRFLAITLKKKKFTRLVNSLVDLHTGKYTSDTFGEGVVRIRLPDVSAAY